MYGEKISSPYIVLPDSSDPNGITRPLLEVRVFYPPTRKKLKFLALVDSGADLCVAPGSIGKALGIDVPCGVPRTFDGVFGPPVTGFTHCVVLDVGGYGITAKMTFFESKTNYLVLGQYGFFDSFKVLFDCSKQIFEIEPSLVLPPFHLHPKVALGSR
jgi:hypothetical protein